MSFTYKTTPMNQEEEKRKFFFDPEYNPQFKYAAVISEAELVEYGSPSDEYLPEAKRIIETVIKQWGTESAYLEKSEGRILTRAEATKLITDYLKDCGLQNTVSLSFSSKYIARTAIDGYRMQIRLPIDYREHSMLGVLHHEIGTHIYRRLNDAKQVWHSDRNKYGFHSYLMTEEGIATLNQHIALEHPYLWTKAVHYYAVYLAGHMSFAQLNQELKKFVDSRERRWKFCLRAKRGQTDTSVPGGYTKDQVYLKGVMQVYHWLKKNDFDLTKLYIGKIALEDIDKAWNINSNYQPVLPQFYSNNPEEYSRKIQAIIKVNKLG